MNAPKSWLLRAVVIVFLLAACTSVAPPAVTPTPEPTAVPPTATVGPHTIVLATEEWPPYVGEKLPGNGFLTAIVREAFARAGYEVKYEFMPWARLLEEVKTGRYAAGFPAYYSDERAQQYIVSDPYLSGPVRLFKRVEDNIAYTTLEDLKPYRIGVMLGYVNTPEFDAADYLQKEGVSSNEQNIEKLLLGRIDLAVIDQFVAQYIMDTSVPQAKGKLDYLDPPLAEKTLHILFSRQFAENEQRAQEFNAALKTMIDDGTIDRILEEYGFKK